MRTTGASVPSHVSVKRRLSNFSSKIRSFIRKVLFKRERTFNKAKLMNVRSSSQWDKTVFGVIDSKLLGFLVFLCGLVSLMVGVMVFM